ncbi:hypothetical protein [Pedobacter sp. MC2016-24]|uniref:hypothetical protein n=1 Tax=Pedobacter sp. MC2016-24 TaxID=2780090 RepID=UPI001880A48B|nr:hypothetical protein [Pedobacter sp. MC2016-24]MBE9598474.1 hypothetical protein [Pedobacter sp. MC2016-24]
MKTIKITYILAFVSILIFSACEKEGTVLLPKIKALKPFEMSGYVLGDTIEQYFDGVKVRDYYGWVTLGSVAPSIAFENEVTTMEFRKKSTGQKIYEQKFKITDENNVVPKFYFDGTTLSPRYDYPVAQGKDYLINFYYDAPKGSAGIDLSIDVLEYYYDVDNNLVVVKTTSFPLASNIEIGKWTDFIKITPPAPVALTQPGTDLYPVVTMRNSKTKEYLIANDRDRSTLQIEIPDEFTSSGKVQSIHLANKTENKINYMQVNNLVQFFP